MRVVNHACKLLITLRMLAGLSISPIIVTAGRYAHDTTQSFSTVNAGLFMDKGIPHRLFLANYAAAFFTMSWSSLRSRSSALNRLISTSLSSTRPASSFRSANSFFHLPIKLVPMSRSQLTCAIVSSIFSTRRIASSLNSSV